MVASVRSVASVVIIVAVVIFVVALSFIGSSPLSPLLPSSVPKNAPRITASIKSATIVTNVTRNSTCRTEQVDDDDKEEYGVTRPNGIFSNADVFFLNEIDEVFGKW